MGINKEIFKKISGYPDYQVSNHGRVKSLQFGKERILKPILQNNGYLAVGLYENSKMKKIPIHQLIAIAFLNHTPYGHKLVVDHIDNNPLNNRLDNIQVITHRENSSKDKTDVGVSWYKNYSKWLAQIQINGKRKNLGYFTEKADALNAYQTARREVDFGN